MRALCASRVGQNYIYTMYGAYTVFSAGTSSNAQSNTAYVIYYGCGQSYVWVTNLSCVFVSLSGEWSL